MKKFLIKNRVIRTATKRKETSLCPPSNGLVSLIHLVQLYMYNKVN